MACPPGVRNLSTAGLRGAASGRPIDPHHFYGAGGPLGGGSALFLSSDMIMPLRLQALSKQWHVSAACVAPVENTGLDGLYCTVCPYFWV
jgi:hypothetical protein